jgi:cytoskeleton protein RodZ
MNAAENKHEEPMPIIEGPGKQLRDIRVAKDLDIGRIASLLHLNVAMLKALEADDFSLLPGTVFVQGYLKNYARLLDTPVEPILDAFQQFRPQGEEKMDLKAAKIKHEVRSSHTVVRLITWLLVIGIIALVVTWWRGYLQWPIDLGLETNGTPSEQQSEVVQADEAPPVGINGTMSLPPLLGKPEILDAPL